MDSDEVRWVWVFHGDGARLAAAVFSDVDKAKDWVKERGLSGMVTGYPLNVGALDWVVEEGLFTPTRDYERDQRFAQKFTSAHQPHMHFKDGFHEDEPGFLEAMKRQSRG